LKKGYVLLALGVVASECAAEDSHVPADGARRFKTALGEKHPGAGECA